MANPCWSKSKKKIARIKGLVTYEQTHYTVRVSWAYAIEKGGTEMFKFIHKIELLSLP